MRNGRTDSSSCSPFERNGGSDGRRHKAPPMDRIFTIYPDSSRWARAQKRRPSTNSTHSFLTEIGATPLPCVGDQANLGRHLRLEKSCCPCPVVTWEDPIPPVSFLPPCLSLWTERPRPQAISSSSSTARKWFDCCRSLPRPTSGGRNSEVISTTAARATGREVVTGQRARKVLRLGEHTRLCVDDGRENHHQLECYSQFGRESPNHFDELERLNIKQFVLASRFYDLQSRKVNHFSDHALLRGDNLKPLSLLAELPSRVFRCFAAAAALISNGSFRSPQPQSPRRRRSLSSRPWANKSSLQPTSHKMLCVI